MRPNRPLVPPGLRRAVPLTAAAVGIVLLAGCTSGTTPAASGSSEPVSGGSITFARLSQDVTSLDPHDAVLTTINAYTLDKIFDTLYALDTDGIPQPSLATSYEVSDDGLTWTFLLRDGVTFSDGSDFTADDVVYSIERHLELGGALPLSAPVTDVVATDDLTVEIHLSEPYTPLLSELSVFSSSILPSELADQDAATFFADPVGTGPFVVGEWDKASGDFALARNDDYREEGLPYLDEVRLVALDDDNQLVQQLQGGQAQIIDDVPIAGVEELQGNGDVTVQTVPSWNSDVLYFNTASDVFSDDAVRRAVGQAIDRDALVAATTFGTATSARTYISTSIQYSDQSVDALAYDPDAAADELAASDHADGATVTLTVDGGSQARTQQAQIIQSALEEIGITVEIKNVDNATFWTEFPAGEYDFALTTTIADTGDPDNVSTWQVYGDKDGGAFNTRYDNAEVNDLVLKGRTTPDGDDRTAIYAQLQEIIAQDVPQFSLAYVAEIKATSASVHGLELIPNGTVRLERTWIDSE
ncbi:ABC transporter substrate-binding protein [Microbacterium sp. 18062]|uniref:ABC transporter substrate-binding protein n=1 Tax=Microbacterium sp. 18062 TaxID=2681410 RepID=UPI00135954C5|nr:ABC transporter substrate-binding protein [Microbacterium sp. 18062]